MKRTVRISLIASLLFCMSLLLLACGEGEEVGIDHIATYQPLETGQYRIMTLDDPEDYSVRETIVMGYMEIEGVSTAMVVERGEYDTGSFGWFYSRSFVQREGQTLLHKVPPFIRNPYGYQFPDWTARISLEGLDTASPGDTMALGATQDFIYRYVQTLLTRDTTITAGGMSYENCIGIKYIREGRETTDISEDVFLAPGIGIVKRVYHTRDPYRGGNEIEDITYSLTDYGTRPRNQPPLPAEMVENPLWLDWTVSDPDGDSLWVDVMIGPDPEELDYRFFLSPDALENGRRLISLPSGEAGNNSLRIRTLPGSGTHYWKVVAWDYHGNRSDSEIFITSLNQ
jgi:hypothetical protein